MLSNEDWLSKAIRFQLAERVFIEKRSQRDGGDKWVVTDGTYVMTKKGLMEYEPFPSSRTKAFIKRTRFDTFQKAYKVWAAINGPLEYTN